MLRIHSLLSSLALLALAQSPAQAQWTQSFLSTARRDIASVQVNGLALFAGGRNGTGLYATVDAYHNASSAWVSIGNLSVARTELASTALGNLAFFAGGATSTTTSTDVIDIYDAFTNTWATYNLSQARFALSAITVGNKVIFAGGATGGPMTAVSSDRVDIYDSTVGPPNDPLAWSQKTLSQARGNIGAATAGSQGVFAGGFTGTTATATVDIYDDISGTWFLGPSLSTPRENYGSTIGVGSKAYIAGGRVNPGVVTDILEIYDADTGAWTLESLSIARYRMGVVAISNTILFAGGAETSVSGPLTFNVVDVFNHGTQTWQPQQNLSQARYALGASGFGDKLLFAGGETGSGKTIVVDIYEPVGVNYCTPTANSTGNASAMLASGSNSLQANNLVLSADSLPVGQFGIFYHGDAQAQLPLGDGIRCVGGSIIRILPPALVGPNGNLVVALDYATAGGQGIASGVTRHFQAWYRDPTGGSAGFNFSDGISITFTP